MRTEIADVDENGSAWYFTECAFKRSWTYDKDMSCHSSYSAFKDVYGSSGSQTGD